MRSTRQKDTPQELALRKVLHAHGLRFRVDYPVLGRRRADVAFPRLRIAVFLDGCFWHGCPIHGTAPKTNAAWWKKKLQANGERDRDTTRRLAAEGWLVIRAWEHEDPNDVAADVARAVRSRT